MTAMLCLRLFGTWEAICNHQPLPPMRTSKEKWLLALLALHAGQPRERDWLAQTLWPDSADSRVCLRKSLAELVRALGTARTLLSKPTPRTLCLQPDALDCDVHAFDRAIARADPASLQQAVALARAPLLAECRDAWVISYRLSRQQALLTALQTMAQHALEAHAYRTAEDYVRQALVQSPWQDEALHRLLLQTLAHQQKAGDLQRAYDTLCRQLRDQQHARPEPETTALFDRLRARLRPLSAPQPTQRSRTPSPPALYHLPQPWTRLVGRERQVAEIGARLLRSRLVTLTGVGGVGKTRLAIAVAQQTRAHYPDGLVFVDLSPVADPGLIAATLARALRLREEPGRALIQTVERFLSARSLLLVVDNAEHLLEGCAGLVQGLLEGCAGLHLLVTSRERLGLAGETVYPVPPLETPNLQSLSSVEQLAQMGAIQLFVERAQAASPAFVLTDENAPVLAALCHRLDGLPLALEMAAARVGSLSVQEMAQRLTDCLDGSLGGRRTAVGRHRTLRALLDWSYHLLSASEQALLGQASVFVGGWRLEAIEGVRACSPSAPPTPASASPSVSASASIRGAQGGARADGVLGALTGLVDKSLVVYDQATGRYGLLETVRQYAWEHLAESGGEALWRTRHRDQFMALAEEALRGLVGAEQGLWLDRLDAEQANLRAALDWCAEDPDGGEAGLRLCAAVSRFWEVRGHLEEGSTRCLSALAHPGAQAATMTRVATLLEAGNLAIRQSQYDEACRLYEESLLIARALDNRSAIAAAVGSLGSVVHNQGDYDRARPLFEESLTIARALGNRYGIATALLNLGMLACKRGDYAGARHAFCDCLTICQALGARHLAASALEDCALLANAQQQFPRAARLYGAAAALREQIGLPWSIGLPEEYAHSLAELQAALGTERFEALFASGRALGWEQAIALALEEPVS